MTSPPTPNVNMSITNGPAAFPGLVAFWDFQRRDDGGRWFPVAGEAKYPLTERGGAMATTDDAAAPFGGSVLQIDEGRWLSIPHGDCPLLDFHGEGAGGSR